MGTMCLRCQRIERGNIVRVSLRVFLMVMVKLPWKDQHPWHQIVNLTGLTFTFSPLESILALFVG